MMAPVLFGHSPGVLVRRLAIRVLEISRAGCLLESVAPIAEGTVGLLEIHLSGRSRIEAFRICRADVRQGAASPYRAAAQFLTIAPPSEHSLRWELGMLEAALVERTENGTMSRPARTNSPGAAEPGADDALEPPRRRERRAGSC